ncbi:SAM-dependent methyltransferase [Craterilacuibacter sp.]|uniref:SAM-dependent methyltransferase n=1 Tax=Craterilacuibacter sp. TaxID=2870909 RepID=UPI003F2CD817
MHLLRAVVLLLLAAVLAWLVCAPAVQPLSWSLLQASIVLLLARVFCLPVVLAILSACFLPLLMLALWLSLPVWVYALGGLLTFSLARNAVFERVPLYLSSTEACQVLADWLPTGCRVLDAGSGDGKAVLALARLRPDVVVTGLENAYLPYLMAKARFVLAGSPRNALLRYGSFWQTKWGDYDVVYAFLSPEPMPRLWQTFLKAGARHAVLISNTFAIPGTPADETLPLSGPLQRELFIWRQPHATC